MKVVLVTYDGRHRKSYELLGALRGNATCRVAAVIAAPLIPLPARPHPLNSKLWRGPTMREAADATGIEYVVAPHASDRAADLLRNLAPDIVLVGGARILPKSFLDAARGRVVNLHPARLPDIRGLDSLQWSVLRDVPPGVTAHWIDERVDAGRLILWRRLEMAPTATIEDIAEALLGLQVAMLPDVIEAVGGGDLDAFEPLLGGALTQPLTDADVALLSEEFPRWRARWATR